GTGRGLPARGLGPWRLAAGAAPGLVPAATTSGRAGSTAQRTWQCTHRRAELAPARRLADHCRAVAGGECPRPAEAGGPGCADDGAPGAAERALVLLSSTQIPSATPTTRSEDRRVEKQEKKRQ